MSKYIDLHTHSTASDGSMSPSELVRYAREKGLAAIALTDHDTIDGIEEAVDEGQKTGLEVVTGVEISVDFEPEMHILGYFFNNNYLNIAGVLASLRENRNQRNPKIIKKLNELGINISMDEVEREAGGNVVGRAHIASVMYKKGYVQSPAEAFEKYLASGRPAYVKRDKLTPAQGIMEILKAGGIPVLAHPIYLKMDTEELDTLLAELKSQGLKGVEAYYVDNTPRDTEELVKLAEKHNLLITGGSDFHGSLKMGIDIGTGRGNLHIPYELLEKLKNSV